MTAGGGDAALKRAEDAVENKKKLIHGPPVPKKTKKGRKAKKRLAKTSVSTSSEEQVFDLDLLDDDDDDPMANQCGKALDFSNMTTKSGRQVKASNRVKSQRKPARKATRKG